MTADDSSSDRDNLSSVSTILGLALFCLLIATILIRRVMVHRASRSYAQQRLLAASNGVDEDDEGWVGMRRGFDSLDDDEPRTIAIGARAALMKRPILWEQHLSSISDPLFLEKLTETGQGNSYWLHLQPTALQLQTPHTTAHFPKLAQNRTTTVPSRVDPSDSPHRRLSRAYERFLFHRDHHAVPRAASAAAVAVAPPIVDLSRNVPTTTTTTTAVEINPAEEPLPSDRRDSNQIRPAQRVPTTVDEAGRETEQRSINTIIQQEESESAQTGDDSREKSGVSEDGIYAHPIHLTFLITMPDPSAPSYKPGSTGLTPWTTTTTTGSITPSHLPPLSLGTTHPIARLPSLRINQDDLDSWWDLPSSSALPFSRFPLHSHSLSTPLSSQYAHGTGHGTFSSGRVLPPEIQRVVAERVREEDGMRERERERVFSEGVPVVPGRRSGFYTGYSRLVRAAGVRRL